MICYDSIAPGERRGVVKTDGFGEEKKVEKLLKPGLKVKHRELY